MQGEVGSVVTLGHHQAGKSSCVGHFAMLLDPTWHPIRQYDRAIENNLHHRKYAAMLDRSVHEKHRGISIDRHMLELRTKSKYYTWFDAPGHKDYVNNIIPCTTQSDAALLIVSASLAEFEEGIHETGQTYEHAVIAMALGIKRVVVGVNKMDVQEVNYSSERYAEICRRMKAILKTIGFKSSSVQFVPISAFVGDNLTTKSSNMPWWNGPTLLQVFDELELPTRNNADKPLRLPISAVWTLAGVGAVAVGRVESGTIVPGIKQVAITNRKGLTTVKSMETHYKSLQRAIPGNCVGLSFSGVGRWEISKGDVLYSLDAPATTRTTFKARIYIVGHSTKISAGYSPLLYCHTAHSLCVWTEIESKIDRKTGVVLVQHPEQLGTGDSAIVIIKLIKPICVENYESFPALGRFVIRDNSKTVAVGIVEEVANFSSLGRMTKPAIKN